MPSFGNRFFTALMLGFAVAACTSQRVSRELIEVQQAKSIKTHYLKVHLKDGHVYVLTSWSFNEDKQTITGQGKYYDFNRKLVKSGQISVPYDMVAILETNDKGTNPGVATMVVVGVATLPLSIICLVDPKACFGSCPTYYVKQDSMETRLVAEGFSSSICKVMEDRDVDIIDLRFRSDSPATIIVKNEALETHLIRYVNLLEVEKKPGERVFQDLQGTYYSVTDLSQPLSARCEGKSILHQISHKDHNEWFSLADSLNLLEKEDVFLEFENPGKESGLVIDKRQTLMTTYLFYQTLSVMGEATGYYLAEIENGSTWLKGRLEKFYNLLGGIEVAVLNARGKWVTVGTINENGPITSDMHLVSLPETTGETMRVRLRMTKGLWRIDMAQLATKVNAVYPKRIFPAELVKEGRKDEEALTKLLNNNEYLVTYPGDVYTINFPAQFSADKEYFIESQGYYIEWMREEWLQHQDLRLVKRMFLHPSGYMKKITPSYKMAEPKMEEVFWNSRYPNNHE